VSNPANTTARDVLINLSAASGGARDVAISRGIAYVGEGDRIEVVNYLPFDTKGVPPAATVSTSATQVAEGSTLSVQANVRDDVQVAEVDLLVIGQLVQREVSFPFSFFAVAPTIAQSGSTFTIQVKAIDTGGNVGLSNLLTVDLVSDTTPPTIQS